MSEAHLVFAASAVNCRELPSQMIDRYRQTMRRIRGGMKAAHGFHPNVCFSHQPGDAVFAAQNTLCPQFRINAWTPIVAAILVKSSLNLLR